MASLYKKTISGKPYWYLREMARVDGKPKMVSERYVGTGAEIEKLLDARESAVLPAQTRHLGFGDAAAVWEVLDRLDVIGVIDSVVGARRADAGASVGTYLALAALNRVVAPTSKLRFADWWKTTAADRFTKVKSQVLDHRRFWDAMHSITVEQLAEIEQRLALAMIGQFGLDISALALDMTSRPISTRATTKLLSPNAAKPSRNAPICAWSAWGWSSPATAASRWSPTSIRATGPTSPNSGP